MYWPTEVIPKGQRAVRPLSNTPFTSRSIPAHPVGSAGGPSLCTVTDEGELSQRTPVHTHTQKKSRS